MSESTMVVPKVAAANLSTGASTVLKKQPNMLWVFVGIGVAVAFLVLGLCLGLVHTSKNNATPSKTKYVRPETVSTASQGMGMGTNVDARSQQCSPVSLKANYQGLVPCTSQPDCASSCMEDVQGFPYACVLVNNGSNTITPEGTLVEPYIVPFEVPLTDKECNGRGKRNTDTGICACDHDFSGENCNVYNLSVRTPGSYCLPPYMNQCDSNTSDTVLTNGAQGPQWTCQCKSKYANLFAQDVEGGSCNRPLICDATRPQKDANHDPKLFSVFSHLDDNMQPVFAQQTVKPNRIVSYNDLATEPCVVATTGRQPFQHSGGVPYSVVHVSPDADPTCKPKLYSNYCEAVPATVVPGDTLVRAVVRGSGTIKDPLRTRIDPPFFEPVPQALHRCPDQFVGSNSENDPCTCACAVPADSASNDTAPCCDGKTMNCVPCDLNGVKIKQDQPGGACVCKPGDVLMMRPTKQSACNTDTDPERVYGDTWQSGAFDQDGEWNGAFTCLNDLRTASLGVAPATAAGATDPSQVAVLEDDKVLWNTLKGKGGVNPVSCYDNTDWLYRDSYDSTSQQFVTNTSNCLPGLGKTTVSGAGADSNSPPVNGTAQQGGGASTCNGAVGQRRAAWSAARDGPLVDDMNHNLPWFTTETGAYGGQCECQGKTYVGKGDASKELAQLGQYIIPAGGEQSWWTCAVDTCAASSSDPANSHFDSTNMNTLFPRCICSKGANVNGDAPPGPTPTTPPASAGTVYKTEISFLEQAAQVPRCIADPCNPGGIKTSVKIPCTDDDENACGGVCYKNRCFYTPSPGTGTRSQCKIDADCAFLNNSGVPSVCKTSMDADGNAKGVCLVMDKERLDAGSTCETDNECGYGMCTGLNSNGVGSCSGGCACNTDLVQQDDNANPLGVSCAKRCAVYPCANKGVCSIEPVSGDRQCVCNPCFVGQYCQLPTDASQHNQPCKDDVTTGFGSCCDPEFPKCRKNHPMGLDDVKSCQSK